MGATHFLTKQAPKVATEMMLNVLAYNMKRVMAISGVAALLEALAAQAEGYRAFINASRRPRVRLGRSGSRFCSDRVLHDRETGVVLTMPLIPTPFHTAWAKSRNMGNR